MNCDEGLHPCLIPLTVNTSNVILTFLILISQQLKLCLKTCNFPVVLLWQPQPVALFNPTHLLATQSVSMSLNMKPCKKGGSAFNVLLKGIRWSVSGDGRPPHCRAYFHFIWAQRFIKLQPVSESRQGRLPTHGGEVHGLTWAQCLNLSAISPPLLTASLS